MRRRPLLRPYSYCHAARARGGNGISDTAIASKSGDIYFFSPEQLDGTKRRPRPAEPLRLSRRPGPVRRPPSPPEIRCTPDTGIRLETCSDGPILSMNVSPDGAHMAFLTASQRHPLRQRRPPPRCTPTPPPPPTHRLCLLQPRRRPAHRRRRGQPGRPLHDRRRPHLLLHRRSARPPGHQPRHQDVYEYVDGRPQLITPGTGTATARQQPSTRSPTLPGLDRRQRQRHRRLLLHLRHPRPRRPQRQLPEVLRRPHRRRLPQPPPPPPCAAAEECHGAGTDAPALPAQGTARRPHRRQRHPRPLARSTARQEATSEQEHKRQAHKRAEPPPTAEAKK